jgi:serine/threonine protein kinase
VYDFGSYSVTDENGHNHAYVILEYVPLEFSPGFNPDSTIPFNIPSTESEQSYIEKFNKLLKILEQMHTHGYVHLDLKPDNIRLTEDDNVKLIDFGFARYLEQGYIKKAFSMFYTFKCVNIEYLSGTPGFIDPYMFFNKKVCFKSDLYSIGTMILLILYKYTLTPIDQNRTENDDVFKTATDLFIDYATMITFIAKNHNLNANKNMKCIIYSYIFRNSKIYNNFWNYWTRRGFNKNKFDLMVKQLHNDCKSHNKIVYKLPDWIDDAAPAPVDGTTYTKPKDGEISLNNGGGAKRRDRNPSRQRKSKRSKKSRRRRQRTR